MLQANLICWPRVCHRVIILVLKTKKTEKVTIVLLFPLKDNIWCPHTQDPPL